MRAKGIYIALAVVAAAAVVGLLALRKKPAPGAAQKQAAVAPVEPANEITLQGKIRPQHILGVAANVPGVIEAFLVEPGQDVYQGQVLARIGAEGLESSREAAALAVERAQEQVTRGESAVLAARMEGSRSEADAQRSQMALDRIERVYSRQRTLFNEGATPRLTYEKAAQDYEAAQKENSIMQAAARAGREHVQAAMNDVAAARKMVESKSRELDAAQQDMAAAEVHSPVDGYVVSRKGEVGKTADDLGPDFFQIATDLYALEIELEPKAQDVKRIIPGMPALVLLLDVQSGAMEGKVKEIKDGKVVVEFGSGNPAIKPGMMADVRLRFP
jgi:multidrug resistance efflux pump